MHLRHDLIFCFVVRPVVSGPGHEFLQLRRSAGDFMGGTWQPISGTIEPDETAWQAALRELREESGLVPSEFYQLDPVNSFYIASLDTLYHSVQFCAIVEPQAVPTLNDEHDAARWIDATVAEEHFMWPGDRRAVDAIRREILHPGLAKPYMRIALPGSL